MTGIKKIKPFSGLEKLEKAVLEFNALKDSSIQDVLSIYLNGIEALFPQMICSVHQVKNNRLYNLSSPSLPASYINELENTLIGDNVGSCGTSAFLKSKVIVTDISNDVRWENYKTQALDHQLHACWSHPIINSEGTVIATFAIYYKQIKFPESQELETIDRSVDILKLILENRQNYEAIREAAILMEQGQELAHFGNWEWDIQNNIVKWSDSLYAIYGLSKESFVATFEGYQNLLHAEDKLPVYNHIRNAVESKKDVTFEERIIRPSGELRYLKSWGKVKTDKSGYAIKMIGACLDITETKMVQEKLLASELRLRSLIDTQTNYVVRTDLTGNYTYCNNKYTEDFGWYFKNQSFLGLKYDVTVVPYHHLSLTKIIANCLENPGKVYQIELDSIKRKGGIKTILWHFICLTDSRGEPSEMQFTGIDVSKRKKAENSLRISNERYEYVNKATNDAIYDWDITNDHTEWGDGFEHLFGYETGDEKYPLEKWVSLLHPDDRSEILQKLKAELADKTKNSLQLEYRFLKTNGNYAYVKENGYILRNEASEATRMIGVLRDVTKQRREESHFRLLESVVTHTNNPVLIAESDPNDVTGLKIVYTNEALTKLTCYTSEELTGKSPLILIGNHFNINILNLAVNDAGMPEPVVTETAVYKKNGDSVWMSLSLSPVADHDGSLKLWICVGQDITERINYIKAIEKQNKKLQQIAWMQSHVVRAPLARLMGVIDLIKNYPNTELEQKELLDHLLSSAHEFDEIIRDISGKTVQP